MYEIRTEELLVPKGEGFIYGRIWAPVTEGKCPAVILSHGYNGCHSDFDAECRYFAENGFIACNFDFCGGSARSRSTGKSVDMTIFTEKADLLAVFEHVAAMAQVDSGAVFLLGGSQGGLVTALAAEELLKRVRGMILYFPACNIPDDWQRRYAGAETLPESFEFWGLTLGKGFIENVLSFASYDHIGAYAGPVLILQGDQDEIVRPEVAQRAAARYGTAEVVIFSGEAHGFTPAGAGKAMKKALQMMQRHMQ